MKNKLIAILAGFFAQLVMVVLGGDGFIAFSLAACFVYVDLEVERLKEGE